jgi:hypothetical protein
MKQIRRKIVPIGASSEISRTSEETRPPRDKCVFNGLLSDQLHRVLRDIAVDHRDDE